MRLRWGKKELIKAATVRHPRASNAWYWYRTVNRRPNPNIRTLPRIYPSSTCGTVKDVYVEYCASLPILLLAVVISNVFVP